MPRLQDHTLGEQQGALVEIGLRRTLPLAHLLLARIFDRHGFAHPLGGLCRRRRSVCLSPGWQQRRGGIERLLPHTPPQQNGQQQSDAPLDGKRPVRGKGAGWRLPGKGCIVTGRRSVLNHFQSQRRWTDKTVTDGRLYIVPTPIGNLEDMTFRAVRILQGVERILAEDTRHTRILCAHYGIHTPMTSFNDHNATQRLPEILQALRNGAHMALVSDAGTPGISDPGLPLIRGVVADSIALEVLPGASAVVTALSGSGFPLDRFVFEGFLPRKGRARSERLQQIAHETRSVALFESPLRLVATLVALQEVGCGDRVALVARELTKRFESWHRGSVNELAEWFQNHPPRGEIVLLLRGREPPPQETTLPEGLLTQLLTDAAGVRAATRQLAQKTGISRNQLYKMAITRKNQQHNETIEEE
ncbi:MAG: 16S rRNA (cytidine(1402)-2'-O)-methyltransferase [Magnetococcales bacterium]|nr:16S rRNA (cytidine(1402)-2'-O)-methyltransferase [Magnetococcales bacterium]